MQLLDGKWACSNSAGDYPSFSGHLLHPCTHDCCGGSGRAPFVMQLTSNFYAPVSALLCLRGMRLHGEAGGA